MSESLKQSWSRRASLALLVFGMLRGAARADAFVTTIPAQVPNPPPLTPDDEKAVPEDPKFRAACLSLIPILLRNIRIQRSLTTETRQWGMVLRIDFAMLTGGLGGGVNRLVFWDGPGGAPFVLIAVGQQIPPLP